MCQLFIYMFTFVEPRVNREGIHITNESVDLGEGVRRESENRRDPQVFSYWGNGTIVCWGSGHRGSG